MATKEELKSMRIARKANRKNNQIKALNTRGYTIKKLCKFLPGLTEQEIQDIINS